MSTDLYRKYIDIINENSQESIQLDEGMLDTIKQKIMSIVNKFTSSSPEAKDAYEKAGNYKSELLDILKSSNNGKEAIQKIAQLANQQAVNEAGIGKMVAGGSLMALPVVTALLDGLYSNITNWDNVPAIVTQYTLMLFMGILGHYMVSQGIDANVADYKNKMRAGK